MTFENLPGRPFVAWHAHSENSYCWLSDEVRLHLQKLIGSPDENAPGLELLLGMIQRRGEGRVIRNKVRGKP